MARIVGRKVLASNLEERRVLHSLGVPALRVPRGQNPYLVARRLRRAARPDEDIKFLDAIAKRTRTVAPAPVDESESAAVEPNTEAA